MGSVKRLLRIGIDPGTLDAPAGVVVVAPDLRVPEDYPPREEVTYTVFYSQEFPLGTEGKEIGTRVGDLLGKLREKHPLARVEVRTNSTGMDQFAEAYLRPNVPYGTLRKVVLTSGQKARKEGWTWHVPRDDLIARVKTLAVLGRLTVPDSEGKLLGQLEPYRPASLLIALALAVWGDPDPESLRLIPQPPLIEGL